MKILTTIAFVLLVSACTTIHFDETEPVVANPQQSQSEWHHIMAFSLVEVSEPVDLAAKCGSNGWESVKTEVSFLNGLIGWIPYVSAIWAPKTVTVQCQGSEAKTGS